MKILFLRDFVVLDVVQIIKTNTDFISIEDKKKI
jgi:hypothetical protein